MDVKEKLVEILEDCDVQINGNVNPYRDYGVEDIADHLLAHGVTVQEWKDGLPEESGLYITFGCAAVPARWIHNFEKDVGKFGAWWNYEPDGTEHPRYRFIEAGNITHWQPLPLPPKGESV